MAKHNSREHNTGLVESQVLSLSYGRIIKKREDALHGLVPASFETYQIVEPGNLILRLTDLQNDQRSLRVGLARDRGIITSAYVCLSPHDLLLPAFAYYFLHSADMQKVFYSMGSGLRQSMGFGDLKRLPVAVPPRAEQEQIVAFLDAHGREVDRLVHAKRRLIALLNEQKQAIIHQAVTRGLGLNAHLKSSSIDWLSQIPIAWSEVSLRQLADTLQTGPFGSQLHAHDYTEGGVPVINPSHLKGGRIIPDFSCAVDEKTANTTLARHRLKQSDIIFARRGELGRCALVHTSEAGWICGTGSLLMRPKAGLFHPEYLLLILSHRGIGEFLRLRSVGATMENLNTSIVTQVRIPCPPLEEQRAIAEYAAQVSMQADLAAARARHEIDLIREYRTRLIADVVTGKLDVRGVELPAVDEAADLSSLDGELADEAMEDGAELELVEEAFDAGD